MINGSENEVQRAIRQAKERIACNGRCKGPAFNRGDEICINAALGFGEQCFATDGAGCRAIRTGLAAPGRGACEAARLIAAEVQTRWNAEFSDSDEEFDYFDGTFDDFDLEVIGDFTHLTVSDSEVMIVLDAAYERAGGAVRNRN